MNYDTPNNHDSVGMVPHDPPASCPACGWFAPMCHCDLRVAS